MGTTHPDGATPDEVMERYRIEREKRIQLRPEGNAQYKDFSGVYKDFDRDPFADPHFTRDARTDEVDVAIIGAGFGGMLVAANLRKLGLDSFVLIDKAGDFGGTWYWNRYPGAACDVESYIYLPLLEETGYMPTERYAKAPEIFGYCQLLGRHFDLYANALFQTDVTNVEWSDDRHRWTVRTTRDDAITSRFVVIAGGVLHKAKLPGIEGIENFRGHAFHTSRWDYAYTGGGPFEPMEKLADKRVGIIGTGATAVQVVPKLAETAKQLFVFQRTPAAVSPRDNEPTDPEWFKSLKPGWQQERIDNFSSVMSGDEPDVDLVHDGWTKLLWVDTKKEPSSPEEAAELERIDFENMERIRARVDQIIENPERAELMKPWYKQSCKRPCFHDEYLQAFNRPNVELVDTGGRGVQQITENGVVVDGVEYPLDCLIYASGFEVTSDYAHRLGFDPHGRDGRSLDEEWAEAPSTLHGVMARGFPNLLMNSTVQGGQTVNFVHTITATSNHIARVIGMCLDRGIDTIEPTDDAQMKWREIILDKVMKLAPYTSTCTPGYLNSEGAGSMKGAISAAYMGRPADFIAIIDAWREAGDFAGVEVTTIPTS